MERGAEPSRSGPRPVPAPEARPVGAACRASLLTAPRTGAIAIVQLEGDVEPALRALTGVRDWSVHQVRLVPIGGVDEGVVVRLDARSAQLMPHGGPRVIQKLFAVLEKLGVVPCGPAEIDPIRLYPEAADRVEALMLAALARAASPLAVDLLLDQPRRWRDGPEVTAADRARSARLDRLVHPPWVALVGPPNVGKSTLSNALLGRSMSIALDLPGTTRDYTAGRLELGGLVVIWHDTPGLRNTDEPLEAGAIALARRLIDRADLLVALSDADHDWPALPRPADLAVASKADLGPAHPGADVAVSAATGAGLPELVRAVRERLVPEADLAHDGPWVFDERLEESRN